MKRPFFKALICASAVLGGMANALAQDNQPRTLSPRTLEPATQNTEVPTVTPVPVRTISGGIDVQSLDSVSTEALGVLSGKDAFPSDMWNGVSRPVVEHLISKLPAAPASPYLRIMQRRLLLSTAQPPSGKSGKKSLLALRAEKLADMGQSSDVVSLIKSAPQNERNNDLAILEAESLFLSGDVSKACGVVSVNMQASTDRFWIKAMAFCRMLAKQQDQAILSLSLLKDLGENDPVYFQLMDALASGEKTTVKNLPAPKPLHIALIAASKAKLGDDVRNTDNPNLLGLLVRGKSVGAVDKAARLNLVNIESLRQAYLSVKFKKEMLEDALASAEKLDPMQAQALLYQVSAQQGQLAVIQTETMGLALELAKAQGTFFTVSRLYQKMIADMERGIDHLWFAPSAVRALLAAGDWDTAKAWYLMLRNAAFTDKEAEKNWIDIRPLAAYAGFDVSSAAVAQALTQWWAIQEETPDNFNRAALVFSLSDGLGLSVPDSLWLALISGPKTQNNILPQPGLWLKMNKAALAGRVGETALMALHGLNQSDLNRLDATFLRDALFGLRALGLERDARIIAVETALLSGL